MMWHLLLCVLSSSLNVMANTAFHGKYHVVKMGSSKIIRCKTSPNEPQEAIHWERKGKHEGYGNELEVRIFDEPDTGNYTCHIAGKLVNHYYVLIDGPEEAKKQDKEHINCEANKFSGIFNCTWPRENERSLFSASFYRKGSRGEMVRCKIIDNDAKVLKATCNDTTYSPYAEEFQPVIFILEAATESLYESYSKTFFIRDILKPHPPKAIHITYSIERNPASMNVSWKYPDSWNKPHSYFPLLSKIDIKLRKSGQNLVDVLQNKLETLCSNITTHRKSKQSRISCQSENSNLQFEFTNEVAHKIKEICVQVKEMYFESSWSDPKCTSVSIGKRIKRHQRKRG